MLEGKEKATFGPLTVELDKRRVFFDGAEIELTAKEFFLLRLFILNPGKTFSREELLSRIWGDDYAGNAEAVDTQLSRLRKKLSVTRPFRFIRTIRGIGYKSDFPLTSPAGRESSGINSNLPLDISSFVGRKSEMESIGNLLESGRCVTLLGSGGVGKTRLALKVAQSLLSGFPDGAWLVRLESLWDGSLIPQTVASALDLSRKWQVATQDVLLEYLRPKKLLLILDNCEHLIKDCAIFGESVLTCSPGVTLLATSQAPLGISGETLWPVAPLNFPSVSETASMEELMAYDAVRLFLDRAHSSHPSFQLTPKNARIIAKICQRLDGIPLAIELAAARVKLISLEQILEKLKDRFLLLTGGSRNAPKKQQTLREAIEWSHNLLSADERVLFRRLPVFSGGFSMAAAETVCGHGMEKRFIEHFSGLVDKSLLVVYEGRGEMARYRLLESLRKYGGEKLAEAGEVEILQNRHLDYFLLFAEEKKDKLQGPAPSPEFSLLEEEHENIRKALEWSRSEKEMAEKGLRLASAFSQFWLVRGYFKEGLVAIQAVLECTENAEPQMLRAGLYVRASQLAWAQGEYALADSLAEKGLAIFEEGNDVKGVASALSSLGNIASIQGRHEEATALYEKCLSLHEKLGDEIGMAKALNNLGNVAYNQGDYPLSESCYGRSLALARKIANKRGIALVLTNFSNVAIASGDLNEARGRLEEAYSISNEMGDKYLLSGQLCNLGLIASREKAWDRAFSLYKEALEISVESGKTEETANCLQYLASFAFMQNKFDKGALLLGAASGIREKIGSQLSFAQEKEMLKDMADAKNEIGTERFDRFFSRGKTLSIEEAVREALSF